jgi:galactokinase
LLTVFRNLLFVGSMLETFKPFQEQLRRTTTELLDHWAVEQTSVRHIISPYRICPIGAHIDHQGGHVLGRTINTGTVISYIPLEGPDIALISTRFESMARFRIGSGVDHGHWARYAQAAALALHQWQPLSRGLAGVTSGTLIGAGLSSSASVGLAYLAALADVNEIALAPKDLVELDRRLENDHLGLQNGILDQSSIVYGQADSFAHIQVLEQRVTAVPDPANRAEVCWLIIYSGLPRVLTSTDFNKRVGECHQAARWLQPGADILSAVPVATFQREKEKMPMALRRRARHYFSEVERVAQGIQAWAAGDLAQFGALINASGASSIHHYECGHEVTISLQQIVSATPGIYGSRFSGGGYGGCVIALADAAQASAAGAVIMTRYRRQFPDVAGEAAVYLAQPNPGLRQVESDEAL